MSIKRIHLLSYSLIVLFFFSCSKERDYYDMKYNEAFNLEKIDSSGTKAFFKIKIDNYTFRNATDSVNYGLIYTYIDKFGYEINTKQPEGKFINSLTIEDTLILDLSLIKFASNPLLTVQFYCEYSGVYDKSRKILVNQNGFFEIVRNDLNYEKLVSPYENSYSSANPTTMSFFDFPYLHFYKYTPSIGPKRFNIQTGVVDSPNVLYDNYLNSSNSNRSAKLFQVGSKNIIRRDSIYLTGVGAGNTSGFLSILDFQNNRFDMTGPNFPTSHFFQTIENVSGRYTLQSLFWFDFDTYAHVMLMGYTAPSSGIPFTSKFIKFNAQTEQFGTSETLPTVAQSKIDQNPSTVNAFITFNNIGYVNIDNQIYTYDPLSSTKWNVFPGNVEGIHSFFIVEKGQLYFVTELYVYSLNYQELKMIAYNNNNSKVQYMIPFHYEENGEIKNKIYGDSSSNSAQFQFNP